MCGKKICSTHIKKESYINYKTIEEKIYLILEKNITYYFDTLKEIAVRMTEITH